MTDFIKQKLLLYWSNTEKPAYNSATMFFGNWRHVINVQIYAQCVFRV